MKLSVFTTITDPARRLDPFKAALECYLELADQVVVVNGGTKSILFDPLIREVWKRWPNEFNWQFIGRQFQRAYEHCTGDWVIHADIDFLFHEKDFQAIRSVLEANPGEPAMSFWKYQFILPDRYTIKSRLVVAVNRKEYGKRIRFDGGGDLCQPTLDGQPLSPDDVMEARLPLYNYECLLKTKPQLYEDKGRFARAWQKHFGEYKLGGPDDESAYNEWWKMVSGRFNKEAQHIALEDHPKFIQNSIKSLTPEQFGYSGFGELGGNDYVKSSSSIR